MTHATTFFAASLITLLSASTALAHPHKSDNEKEEPKKSWPYFGGSDDADVTSDDSTSEDMSIDEFTEKLDARISKHAKRLEESMDKMDKKMTVKTFKFDSGNTADDLREAGKAVESALSDSGMISGLADMLADLAEDFDVKESSDGTKVFMFDGKKMGHIKMENNREETGKLNIGGLGQNLSIDRETYIKDGKTKTRIVIEMDGGDDVEIDLPELEVKSKKN